ncbi:Uncharacterised protein [Streptococcus pneumoniae]|nr:Uncharacterised protein [Streptococcus pneumoniae]CWA20782.1 Uncharacterised protein [Streptococcus pneumoniae]
MNDLGYIVVLFQNNMQPVLTKYKIDAINEFYSSFSHSYYTSKRDGVN